MEKSSIVVIGSSNTDMVVKASHLPVPGETIIGGNFFMNAGGKGANQAVAAARLGGSICFIAKVGNDIFGMQATESFKQEGIDTSAVMVDTNLPSGVALITVDDKAENCIVVAPGANAALSVSDLNKYKSIIESATIVLMQLETPVEAIAYASSLAAAKKIKVVLNPAPACALPDDLLRNISIITPNEKEAEMLTGIPVTDIASAEKAATVLKEKGVEIVVITMGAKGALILKDDKFLTVETPVVKAVDTTAAGDVFNGALVVALSEGKQINEAVSFACRAASISVTRFGAQASAPYRKELEA
ncbi:MAG: ribokinase [Chitinophagaceae bacterium]|nr:ribokinase [Chitinophagaceae bacterium]